eukprot:GHVU01062203.1.p1 GENE.GHVU01062203.1~~GHVU01062203.1.p1  ORF type:complete len:192 (+),score=31.00 GHVU01062203.1:380-955(+)
MGNISLSVKRQTFCYDDPEHYTYSGEFREEMWLKQQQMGNIFEQLAEELFGTMIKQRKEIMTARNKFHASNVVEMAERFENFTVQDILDLKAQFQTFDLNQDGLIDFPELCAVLDELGDESDGETRKTYFDELDHDSSGAVDFEEFLDLIKYVGKDSESGNLLGHMFQEGTQNTRNVRKLSVAQQITTGLF